ncbi:MAG: PAS domain-containing sensor histidine kinase [Oligoflexia bacterium]|nr:PAS domain-containing sensor histidine kinase [Oligoflexia bacterium]
MSVPSLGPDIEIPGPVPLPYSEAQRAISKRRRFDSFWSRYIDPTTYEGEPNRSKALRYAFALSTMTLSLLVNALLAPMLGDAVLAIPLGGLIFGTLLGGLGPGLASLLLGILSEKYYFIPPMGQLFAITPEGAIRLAIFIALGLLNVSVSNSFREAFRQITRDRVALKSASHLVDAIVENLPAIVFVKEAKHLSFALINRAAEHTFGWRREEMRGKTDYDFFSKREADFFRAKDLSVLDSGKLVEIPEETVQSRDRGTRLLRTRKVPILGESGEPLYLLGISEDITETIAAENERKRLAAELEVSVRAREQVLAVVSHDLKNPLSAIRIAVDGLQQQSAGNVRMAGLVKVIRSSALRMERLIRDIVDLAAFEAGSLALERKQEDVNAIFEDARLEMQPLAERKSIRLSFDASGARNRSVVGERNRIYQVLSNLISNAIRHTPERGAISVSAQLRGQEMRFEVRDTGPGIPPELVPHIFKRYQKGDSTQSGMAGLGLSIAKAITEAHGGRIGVETAPNAGAAFWFTIPAEPARGKAFGATA